MDSKFDENKFENSPIMIMAVDSSRAGVGRAKFVFTSSYDMHYSKFYTQTLLCDQNTEDKQSKNDGTVKDFNIATKNIFRPRKKNSLYFK